MKNIKIPSKAYMKQAKNLLFNGDVNIMKKKYDYYHVNEKIYDSPLFQELLKKNNIQPIKISSGTSDRKAFRDLIDEAVKDLKKSSYYRSYTSPQGNISARKSLAYVESIKFKKDIQYTEKEICITEGSTGAITTVFEYIKRNFPKGEVLIAIPCYYLYSFTSKYYDLSFKEVFTLKLSNQNKNFLSLASLIQNISNKTKLIVLTQPNNPTGQIYDPKELKELLKIARRKNILVLFDELFCDLIFDETTYIPSDVLASQVDALQNIVVVKGYSKTKNLAAFRVGYLFSKNKKVISECAMISEQRQCFAGAFNYTGVIILDSFLQTLYQNSINYSNKKDIAFSITQLKKISPFQQLFEKYSNAVLLNMYNEYKKYYEEKKSFYSDNFDLSLSTFKNEIDISLPKKSAFNTFVKIKGLETINQFDFCFNFYITCGVETQIGPCYGYDQKTWERDSNLGFWLRLTFARDRKQYVSGLKKFIEFKKLYIANQNKFIKTNLYF